MGLSSRIGSAFGVKLERLVSSSNFGEVSQITRIKGGAHAIPTIPRASRCFNRRDIDIDSTRPLEPYCGGLPDCYRHTGSDGGAALGVVGPIILSPHKKYSSQQFWTEEDELRQKHETKLLPKGG